MDNQNNYENMNNNGQPPVDYEKKAKTIFILGLVGLIAGVIIGFCCCAIVGPVMGIITLVMANGIKDQIQYLSEEGQKNVKVGKILGIIAIAVGVIFMIINMATMSDTMAQMEELMEQYTLLM
ncbi:MAG: hypothetical protein IJ007_08735 [Oscillospiraceae bacterium]|nr:hypothetical protein [Oscillospiraceae bacterium]